MNIAQERCFNHASREAVARCPECGRYFCRECVSEHEDRLICTCCLKRLAKPFQKKQRMRGVLRLLPAALGLLLLWSTFYLLGKTLLAIPTSFQHADIARDQRGN